MLEHPVMFDFPLQTHSLTYICDLEKRSPRMRSVRYDSLCLLVEIEDPPLPVTLRHAPPYVEHHRILEDHKYASANDTPGPSSLQESRRFAAWA